MPEKELPRTVSRPVFNTYALTVCALLTALSVVLARVLTLIPAETTRISLEAVPIVLSGLLFGPIPGAVVGFAADLIGCLFSPFGYNPIFCVPPILYGLLAGVVRMALGANLDVNLGLVRGPVPADAGEKGQHRAHRAGIPAGHYARLRPVAEHGAGSGVRRRCQAGIFSGKTGVPQHPICPHRHGGHADRVAAAAPRRTQRCAAAYPGQGRRRA